MAWTSPHTWSVSEKVTAALLNTHLRDNLQFVFDVITGASATKIPNTSFTDNTINGGKLLDNTVANAKLTTGIDGAKLSAGSVTGAAMADPITFPGRVNVGGDTNWGLLLSGGLPLMQFDVNDYYYYFRSANKHVWAVNNVEVLLLNGNGMLTGTGFYDSGEVTVTSGATLTFNTGFANGGAGALNEGPRLVSGVWGAAGNCNNPVTDTGTLKWGTRTNTGVNVTNNTGSSQSVRVWAITNV